MKRQKQKQTLQKKNQNISTKVMSFHINNQKTNRPRWKRVGIHYWTEHWFPRREREHGFDQSEGEQRKLEANHWHQRCWTKCLWQWKWRAGRKRKERLKPFPWRIWCFHSMINSPSRQNPVPFSNLGSLLLILFSCVRTQLDCKMLSCFGDLPAVLGEKIAVLLCELFCLL